VPSANNIGSDLELALRGRSSTYIMNNKGPRIDPGGTCFNVPQSEKKVLVALGDLISTFCFLLTKENLNQSVDRPRIP
jgi:hypothetical protein